MKQLVFLFALLFIFSCESEPLEGFDQSVELADDNSAETEDSDDEADVLVYPEPECGELIVNIDGVDIVISGEDLKATERSCASGTRKFSLTASVINPDNSAVYIIFNLAPAIASDHILEDYAIADDFCFKASITAIFFSSLGEEGDSYASFSDYEGLGTFEISEYAEPDDAGEIEGSMTSRFEVTLGLRGPGGTGGDGSLYFYGSMNKVAYQRVCDSPFC